MNAIKRFQKLNGTYRKACTDVCEWGVKNPNTICALLGVILLFGGAHEAYAANGGTPKEACNELLSYVEGGFASLVAAAAGLGAIIASAVGGFKAAWGLLVVSIGAFILRSYIGVFLAKCQ